MAKRIKLIQTCGACPEQYDAYIDGDTNALGYLRLRHGSFRAEYRGEVVFRGDPRGDGCFEFDERELWLNRACQAILDAHDQVPAPEDTLYEIEPYEYPE
jgi:hypothetical protein